MRKIHELMQTGVYTGGCGTAKAAGKGSGPVEIDVGTLVADEASVDTCFMQVTITPTTVAASSFVTVYLEGSLNGTSYGKITNTDTEAITTSGAETVKFVTFTGPVPKYVRPVLSITNTGADSTTSVTVTSIELQVSPDPWQRFV